MRHIFPQLQGTKQQELHLRRAHLLNGDTFVIPTIVTLSKLSGPLQHTHTHTHTITRKMGRACLCQSQLLQRSRWRVAFVASICQCTPPTGFCLGLGSTMLGLLNEFCALRLKPVRQLPSCKYPARIAWPPSASASPAPSLATALYLEGTG
jgi:hypothetical protein